MAWLTEVKRLNKDTGKKESYFAIQWREAGRQQTRALGFIRSVEANTLLKVLEGKLALGEPVAPPSIERGSETEASDAPALGAFLAETYLPIVRRDRAVKTAVSAQTSANALAAKLGGHPLASITYGVVDRYITDRLAEGRAPRTVRIELWALRGALAYAVKLGHLARVPELPIPDARRVRPAKFLTVEESRELLAALKPTGSMGDRRDWLSYLAVVLALDLGLRKGEIMSRRWHDVRWDDGPHGSLLVDAQPAIGFQVKTRRSRIVPLTPAARRELLVAHARAGNPSDGWVFPSPRDASKPREDFKVALHGACRRAGLAPVHPHALRHTWASRLAMQGVDRRSLMELGGWTSGAMLDEVYAHVPDQHKARMIAASGVESG